MPLGNIRGHEGRASTEVAGERKTRGVPEQFRPALSPVAARVFWWGKPEEWLDYAVRFGAQIMTYGGWDDTALIAKLLGESF
jgi:hypothetical protein